ncbi:hypothetical protein C488_14592 [Natrinema pellirubrum DSM 15624]|uniref:GAPS4 PD-(D/E)XK nuclease domain-containing protein n=1 Tax=Natrinema pellirubrum (strain DSM 15624 / CIP 106293 / JCM 10476 / NCIMB 786 / 157) TaxID=797303 RepID=L0JMA0_NATP1|nr:hypothetical protein [Natrinema pellirubrum]AGB31707.1 hypothetical protein Natpe_1831 [Natrinema pellirubrum DSM 15624]ELY72917.1 hypothetical protein C488_14592 [Natrinema pellirubrum DSM 15624]
MGEEVRNTGNRAEDRLIALLQEFNWEYIGGGRDIDCASRKHERDEHGIDGYMAYEDPYLSAERGVIVESKSKQWESWGPSSLQSDAKQVRTALECSTRSEDFDKKLNNYENRRRDTAILGAFTNDDEYDHEAFQAYVESCKVKRGGGPSHILVLGNRELNRLASIQNKYREIKEKHTEGDNIVEAELNFYYPSLQEPRAAPKRRDTISFEYLFSDYVYAKLQKTELNGTDTDTTDVSIVFNSGGINQDSLEFLYYSLRDNDGLDTDEVWVYSYLPNGGENADETYDSAVDSLENILPPDKGFRFTELPQVEYKSYAEDLTED